MKPSHRFPWARLRACVDGTARVAVIGEVQRSVGLTLEASGLRGEVGDLCRLENQRGAALTEIVGFRDGRTLLLPLEETPGVSPGDRLVALRSHLRVNVGPHLLGRVLDGLGRPIDGLGPLRGETWRALRPQPINALSRPAIEKPFRTGVRAIDLMATLGQGQRVGIMAGSGVGKSTLLGMILQHAQADVVVLALIGERGREVRHFIDGFLDEHSRPRSVVVTVTSDRPAMQRIKGAHLAATIAEHFSAEGKNVLLVMDSVTRFASAIREAGLAAGEPPTTRGYPPSMYAELPRLIERLGNSERGSITALLTVLVEGDDFNEPVTDCLRGLLDGHIILTRALAERGHFPAIDVLKSLSRLMPDVTDEVHRAASAELRKQLSLYQDHRDLIEVGAYRKGTLPDLDHAMEQMPMIERLFRQRRDDRSRFEDGREVLLHLGQPRRSP